MSIKKIHTKNGLKLKNTKTGKMAGSVGKGKEAPSAVKPQFRVKGRWKVSLLISHPDIASQAYNWDPSEVTAGSREEKEWVCSECGYVWKLEVVKKVQKRGGYRCKECPRLRGGAVSLASAYPEIAKEAYGWDPNFVTHSSPAELPWKCSDCERIWTMQVSSRTASVYPGRCSCKTRPKLDSLLYSHPTIAKDAFGWDPASYTASTLKKLEWHCLVCAHEWSASPLERVRSPRRWGCLNCSQGAGQKIEIQGQIAVRANLKNSLVLMKPELASELLDQSLGALVSYGARVKVDWKCKVCEYVWPTPVANRVFNDSGCPNCSIHGFDIQEPAFLYFLIGTRIGVATVQYGISNNINERVRTHRRSGFRPIPSSKFLKFQHGRDATVLEKQIGQGLIFNGVPSIKNDPDIQDKFPGFTESFRYELFPVDSLSDLLNKLSIVPSLKNAEWIAYSPK